MTLASLSALFLAYRYPIIFVTTVIEGPIIMVLSGVMIRLGTVELIPVYLVLIAADLLGDTFWYYIGFYFAHPVSEKYGKYVGLTPEVLGKTHSAFRNHERKILLISKLTLGLGVPLAPLVMAGMSKMPFRRYISTLFLGQFIWTGILLTGGYYFGQFYERLNGPFRVAGLVVFVVVLFLLVSGIRSYLKNKSLEL